jgi:hypothetical protein
MTSIQHHIGVIHGRISAFQNLPPAKRSETTLQSLRLVHRNLNAIASQLNADARARFLRGRVTILSTEAQQLGLPQAFLYMGRLRHLLTHIHRFTSSAPSTLTNGTPFADQKPLLNTDKPKEAATSPDEAQVWNTMRNLMGMPDKASAIAAILNIGHGFILTVEHVNTLWEWAFLNNHVEVLAALLGTFWFSQDQVRAAFELAKTGDQLEAIALPLATTCYDKLTPDQQAILLASLEEEPPPLVPQTLDDYLNPLVSLLVAFLANHSIFSQIDDISLVNAVSLYLQASSRLTSQYPKLKQIRAQWEQLKDIDPKAVPSPEQIQLLAKFRELVEALAVPYSRVLTAAPQPLHLLTRPLGAPEIADEPFSSVPEAAIQSLGAPADGTIDDLVAKKNWGEIIQQVSVLLNSDPTILQFMLSRFPPEAITDPKHPLHETAKVIQSLTTIDAQPPRKSLPEQIGDLIAQESWFEADRKIRACIEGNYSPLILNQILLRLPPEAKTDPLHSLFETAQLLQALTS